MKGELSFVLDPGEGLPGPWRYEGSSGLRAVAAAMGVGGGAGRPARAPGDPEAATAREWETPLDAARASCDIRSDAREGRSGTRTAGCSADRDRVALSDQERVYGSIDLKPRKGLQPGLAEGKAETE
jgi:hypothetical protein